MPASAVVSASVACSATAAVTDAAASDSPAESHASTTVSMAKRKCGFEKGTTASTRLADGLGTFRPVPCATHTSIAPWSIRAYGDADEGTGSGE